MLFIDENYVSHRVSNREILDYINELESENKRLSKELDSEWKDRMKAEEDLHKAQKNYKIGLSQSQKRNQQLKDRIAELEKENERLNKLFTYDKSVRDRCFEFVKDIKEETLKQFAERLKEKFYYVFGNEYEQSVSGFDTKVLIEYIEETLKEFIDEHI